MVTPPEKFSVNEILFWYDAPRIFTMIAYGPGRALAVRLLVFQFSDTIDKSHWAGHVTSEEIARLKSQELTLREVVSRDGHLFNGRANLDFDTPGRIPLDDLPDEGTFLYHNP